MIIRLRFFNRRLPEKSMPFDLEETSVLPGLHGLGLGFKVLYVAPCERSSDDVFEKNDIGL